MGERVHEKREQILQIAARHTEDALHWYIRDRILEEAVPL